jgi:hypothetical protein
MGGSTTLSPSVMMATLATDDLPIPSTTKRRMGVTITGLLLATTFVLAAPPHLLVSKAPTIRGC